MKLKLLGLDQIAREPLPRLDWLVEPVIGWGDRAVLAGDAGSFKSWLLLHLSLFLALGRSPWLGHPISSPRRILYIDEEMPEWEVRRRLKRIMAAEGIEPDTPGLANLQISNRAGFTITDHDLLRVRALFDTFNPDVIVIETVARVLVGSENSSAEVARMWRSLSEHLQDDRRTLILSHHINKPNPDESGLDPREPRHRIRGSSDILAGADTVLGLVRLNDYESRLVSLKPRFSKPFKPFVVTLHSHEEPEQEMSPITVVRLEKSRFLETVKAPEGLPGAPFTTPIRL